MKQMNQTALKIKNWESRYENAETKKYKKLSYVLVPNKMDGLGYRLLAGQKDNSDLFSAWILMVEVASHGDPSQRGWLLRDGVPLTAEHLALMTGFKKKIFEKAIKFFLEAPVQWLEE